MKKYSIRVVLIIVLIAAIALVSFACSNKSSNNTVEIYLVENNAEGVAESSTIETPPFEDAGQEGWTLQAVSGAGLAGYIFVAEPEAIWPAHSGGETRWYAYVLDGSGILELADMDGKISSRVNFDKGDFLIFEPDTMHGWDIGKDGTEILFILGITE